MTFDHPVSEEARAGSQLDVRVATVSSSTHEYRDVTLSVTLSIALSFPAEDESEYPAIRHETSGIRHTFINSDSVISKTS